jgi:hypothetical protein
VSDTLWATLHERLVVYRPPLAPLAPTVA